MTDKLTDNEIKKALKSRMYKENKYMFSLLQNALDLINRLQAENTELLGKIEGLEANRVELLENIEQLESVITQIKAEAYEEFAQKLESIIMWSPKNHISITAKDVRNILKGLVGEDNG